MMTRSIAVVSLVALAASLDARQPPTDRLAVEGGTLVVEAAGAGPAVVFLHGAFLDRGTWDRQMPVFARQHRAIRYDIRPFGESTLPEKPYKPTDDLRQLLDALEVDRAHLVGHSFGGNVAIEFALEHPARVASLSLVNSGLGGAQMPADEQQESIQVFVAARESDDKAIEAWLRLGLWSASRARSDVMEAIERGTRASLRAFRMSAPPFVPMQPPAKDRLAELRVPTLVVTGDRDTPGNRAVSDSLARGVAGARLVTIAGADHAIPIGWADDLNETLLTFLRANP